MEQKTTKKIPQNLIDLAERFIYDVVQDRKDYNLSPQEAANAIATVLKTIKESN